MLNFNFKTNSFGFDVSKLIDTFSSHSRPPQFSLDESQLQQDWAILLSLATQPGASLEQLHIFALAHILRLDDRVEK